MTLDRSRYPGVPEDFPIEEVQGAVSGAQLKLLMVEEGGHYYATGTSPSEVQEALEICLDLQLQLTDYCVRKSRQGHEPYALLMHVYQYLLQKDWCHPAQSRWVCLQISKQLHWSLPVELQASRDSQAPESGGAP